MTHFDGSDTPPLDDRPLRVLHVLEALEGGTARHVVDVVSAAQGIDHHLAVPAERIGGLTDRQATRAAARAGAAVHLVPMTRRPISLTNGRAVLGLAGLVRALAPDVLHVHSSIGGLLGRLAVRRAVPVVYTPNGIAVQRFALVAERALGSWSAAIVAVSESEGALLRAREDR